MVERLKSWNVEFDFSECTLIQACFRDCYGFTRLGVIDLRKCANVNQFYYNGSAHSNNLSKIDEFMFPDYVDLSTAFTNCNALTTVGFVGKIGNRNCNIPHCPFDAPTVRNLILNCLENYAGTEKEFAYTLTLNVTAWANVNADTENPPPSGDNWQDYVQLKGWNVA